MKKQFKQVLVLCICAICSIVFFGCEFKFDAERGELKTISGVVTYNSSALEGVKIRSNTHIFATTNAEGEFSFSTRLQGVDIFAEKTGYAFSGRFTLTSDKDDANFTASLVENLNGSLTLKKVKITPTSISSLLENNFDYDDAFNKSKLKIAGCNVMINLEEHNLITSAQYVEKNAQLMLNVTGATPLDIDETTSYNIKTQLSAYFTYNQVETVATEEPYAIINIEKLTTANIVSGNLVELYLYGINSSYGGFTYNLCLEFEFTDSIYK